MKALVIIDMLKDFVDKDGALYCGPQARNIIPFIENKMKEYKKQHENFLDNKSDEDTCIIFVMDCHEENDEEFKLFPKHCVKGTDGSDIIDELENVDISGTVVYISKTRFGGFFDTALEEELIDIGVTEVEVVGVCTSICVMDTVQGFFYRNIPVTVFKNGVADLTEDAHKYGLERMKNLYGSNIE